MQMRILECNAVGNPNAAKTLNYRGKQSLRPMAVLDKLCRDTSWDMISVHEISYNALIPLNSQLSLHGYRMYINPAWSRTKEKYRYTCLSVLFVHKRIKFQQINENKDFPTVLRYVCGKFTFW